MRLVSAASLEPLLSGGKPVLVCCLLQSRARMWSEAQQAVHVLGRCQKKLGSKETASREAGASAQRCCEKRRMRMVKVSHHNSSDT